MEPNLSLDRHHEQQADLVCTDLDALFQSPNMSLDVIFQTSDLVTLRVRDIMYSEALINLSTQSQQSLLSCTYILQFLKINVTL
jgi:hypothetical protein